MIWRNSLLSHSNAFPLALLAFDFYLSLKPFLQHLLKTLGCVHNVESFHLDVKGQLSLLQIGTTDLQNALKIRTRLVAFRYLGNP